MAGGWLYSSNYPIDGWWLGGDNLKMRRWTVYCLFNGVFQSSTAILILKHWTWGPVIGAYLLPAVNGPRKNGDISLHRVSWQRLNRVRGLKKSLRIAHLIIVFLFIVCNNTHTRMVMRGKWSNEVLDVPYFGSNRLCAEHECSVWPGPLPISR